MNSQTRQSRLTEYYHYRGFGEFKLVPFDSMEDLDAYIQHPKYLERGGPEGICFGFTVKEFADNNYELELMFNDLMPFRYKSLPS
jgi:hypothetical protein